MNDARGRPHWRDAAAYNALQEIDRAGLMWEWLRRDPDYIAWHTRASSATLGTDATQADPRQWGLHFRGGSNCRLFAGTDHLERRDRPGDLAG